MTPSALLHLLEQFPQRSRFASQDGLRRFNDAQLFGDPFREASTAQAVCELAQSGWIARQLALVEALGSPRVRE